MNPTLHTHTLGSLPLLARGKVRDNYAVGNDRILMVASDRISAFDVVMGEPIPGKGALLTQMALFWFDKLGHICPNHLTGDAPESVVSDAEKPFVSQRSMPWYAAIWPAVVGRNTKRASRCAACPCQRV